MLTATSLVLSHSGVGFFIGGLARSKRNHHKCSRNDPNCYGFDGSSVGAMGILLAFAPNADEGA